MLIVLCPLSRLSFIGCSIVYVVSLCNQLVHVFTVDCCYKINYVQVAALPPLLVFDGRCALLGAVH